MNNACLNLQHCLKHFKQSTTVVLLKLRKKDCIKVKAYRPIALLNTLDKKLKAVIAKRIAFAVEKYQLLSRAHFEGRKRMSIKHALHELIKQITQV